MQRLLSLIILISFLTPVKAQILLILPEGHFLLEQNPAKLTKIQSVIDLTDLDPDPKPDPDPDDSLKSKVQSWSNEINEPKTAEALALAWSLVHNQIDNANSLLAITKAQKATNEAVISSSSKKAQWQALFTKVWSHLDDLEANNKLNTKEQYKQVWKEIGNGLKASAGASWELNGLALSGEPQNLTPQQWQELITTIIKLIMLLFGGLG